ncbi:hypothetical protein [Paractinoplanes toevensis]|uniref:Uncharacterized protein n=1 Tax=Paractinoplanes toevensis TaxID=571911 RepID=A0A919W181_9ACTN|nr:hypothetical protein [Actinoplanes toevensis]GIM90109.1 hypothetical protein Ato02nite_019020 [Actinoplanes toevensis]
MLFFDTVHAITEYLVAAVVPAASRTLVVHRLTQAPVLLVVLDEHRATAGLRLRRTLQIPLPHGTASRHPLALLLRDTAEALSRHGASHPILQAVHTLRAAGDRASVGDRALTWAARYTDIDVSTGLPQQVVRIDGVDVDGRSYQLSLAPGETCPVAHLNDRPDPHESSQPPGCRHLPLRSPASPAPACRHERHRPRAHPACRRIRIPRRRATAAAAHRRAAPAIPHR